MVTPALTVGAPAQGIRLVPPKRALGNGLSLARLLFSLRCIVRREPISQGLEHVAPSIATSDPTPRRKGLCNWTRPATAGLLLSPDNESHALRCAPIASAS